ncbi:MAG: transglycosylase domain-containing protein [Clostridiales bacterium]|nr:MAG: transglycosylase domain-containing protein [Clostridiales bacterium]
MKNTHLTQEKSIKRKLNEIKIAKQLEKEYSKDDILTSYLNVSYFGGGLYGVKKRGKRYFQQKPFFAYPVRVCGACGNS